MVNCLHFRAHWNERDRLEPAASMRMRRHLAACQRCQAYDQQMRTGGHSLKGLADSQEKPS